MAEIGTFKAGGYRYIKAVFQYSGGVAAEPAFEIERARLREPLPLLQGFAVVEEYFKDRGIATTSFCACELRSPAPFTEQGFIDFNRQYVKTLERWGIYRGGDDNPVARTNVCPEYHKPAEPALYAFSYTVPARGARGSFIVAGGGEAREGGPDYRSRTVRLGDTSPDGMREKVTFVIAEMERRLAALGFGWRDAASTQAYTVHDIGALVGPELARRGAMRGGLEWHFARPPVVNLEYEMDVRGAARELVI